MVSDTIEAVTLNNIAMEVEDLRDQGISINEQSYMESYMASNR